MTLSTVLLEPRLPEQAPISRQLESADADSGGSRPLLGGSWAVVRGVISRVTIHTRGLMTLLYEGF